MTLTRRTPAAPAATAPAPRIILLRADAFLAAFLALPRVTFLALVVAFALALARFGLRIAASPIPESSVAQTVAAAAESTAATSASWSAGWKSALFSAVKAVAVAAMLAAAMPNWGRLLT